MNDMEGKGRINSFSVFEVITHTFYACIKRQMEGGSKYIVLNCPCFIFGLVHLPNF
jgi:hypothetical protein